jgi:predicted adenine nucleotide alpha hydrolase (AANH) superfamily ATPase
MEKLLLHVCCAPCFLGCADSLKEYDVTLLFYNPNIHPSGEYLKRLFFVRKAAQEYKLPLVIGDYNFHKFFEKSKGLEQERENGARCEICFDMRLRAAAKIAKDKKFDFFSTTLSVSPFKNFGMIKRAANRLEKEFNVQFLAKDFLKDDGYKKSIWLSKDLGIYRQKYCGCLFSLNRSVASPKE